MHRFGLCFFTWKNSLNRIRRKGAHVESDDSIQFQDGSKGRCSKYSGNIRTGTTRSLLAIRFTLFMLGSAMFMSGRTGYIQCCNTGNLEWSYVFFCDEWIWVTPSLLRNHVDLIYLLLPITDRGTTWRRSLARVGWYAHKGRGYHSF